jgi:hypothetical protein
MLGLRRVFRKAADQVFADATLTDVSNFNVPIAANQKVRVRYWLIVSVGATGGVRAKVNVPAGGTSYLASFRLLNTAASTVAGSVQTAAAAFTNALANAGSHILEIEIDVVNGATAGDIQLQVAQNTTDALTLTLKAGSSADAIVTA